MRFQLHRLAIVPLLAISLGGCALFHTKGGAPVPVETQLAQLQQVDQARRVGSAIVDAVTNLYHGEIVVYGLRKPDGTRVITPVQHQQIADAVIEFGTSTKPAVAALKDAVSSPQTIRSSTQLILDEAKKAIGKIGAISPEVKGYVDTAMGLLEVVVVPRI